ncbi:MAG: hypothetical protein ACJ768_24570 [Gaiellaceae bacterium]|jgi:hypothetical protein
MARTQQAGIRVDREVIDAVRARHGLVGAPVSVVVRYALAVAGGVDPAAVARLPIGRRPRTRAEAQAA